MCFTPQELEVFAKETSALLGILDQNSIVIKINECWEPICELPASEIVGKSVISLIHTSDRERFGKLFEKYILRQKLKQFRFRIVLHTKKVVALMGTLSYHKGLIYVRAKEITAIDLEHQTLTMMSAISNIGAWNYQLHKKRFYCTAQYYKICDDIQHPYLNFDHMLAKYEATYQDVIRTAFDQLLEKHIPYNIVAQIITKKGKKKWVRTRAEPILQNGTIIGINGTLADITQVHDYQEQLKVNRETEKLALKGIRSGVFDHDLIEDKVFYTQEFRKMLGFSLSEAHIPEHTFRQMIHPEDREEAFIRHTQGLQSPGYHYYNHYRLRNIKGEYRHYEVYAWRKKDAIGHTIRMVGNLIDVEEKFQHQQEMLRYQRRLQAVINNGYLYTILLDPKGYILFADDNSRSIMKKDYGIDPKEVHCRFADVIPHNFTKGFQLNFSKAKEGEVITLEVSRPTNEGGRQWLEMVYKPVLDQENQKVTGILINMIDINSRKNAELMAEEAKGKIIELTELKNNILSNLSHEIRTPLNGIIGINELLSRDIPREERQKLLDMQRESSERLTQTLDAILNLSQIASLQSNLVLEVLPVSCQVRSVFEHYKHQAIRKNLSFLFHDSADNVYIHIDKDLLRLALNNIINNAIKYTFEGGIDVYCETENDRAVIRIVDTGIGIKRKNLSRIFDLFVQESQGLSRKFEGTGIGLSLSKKYIELLEGSLKVESTEGVGSEFIIKLPIYHEHIVRRRQSDQRVSYAKDIE